MSIVFAVVGVTLFLLGAIGSIFGKAPFIKLRGRGNYFLMLIGGVALSAIGGSLLPKTITTIHALPNTATIRVDGKTYGNSARIQMINGSSYTVVVEAMNYKTKTFELEGGQKAPVNISLQKMTNAEIAAQKLEAEKQKNKTTEATVASVPKPDLQFLGATGATTDSIGAIRIQGRVKNNSDREYGYAQVQFNLYDKAGNQIGSAMANINNLEAGGVWKFEAYGMSENVATYKFKEVTGF